MYVSLIFHSNTELNVIFRLLDFLMSMLCVSSSAAVAYRFASQMRDDAAAGPVVLVVADVYVGDVTLGSPDLTRPPLRPDGKLYDTTVDNIDIPSIFVKYNQHEFCPHYFVLLKV